MKLSSQHGITLAIAVWSMTYCCAAFSVLINDVARPQQPHMAMQEVHTKATSISADDKKFIRRALETGQELIQLGHIAIEKSQFSEVKAFGHRIATDNEQLNAEFETLAQTNNVSQPKKIASSEKAIITHLQNLTPSTFDPFYMKAVVDIYEQLLKDYEQQSKSSSSEEIKIVIYKATKILQEHQNLARELRATIEGSSSTNISKSSRIDTDLNI